HLRRVMCRDRGVVGRPGADPRAINMFNEATDQYAATKAVLRDAQTVKAPEAEVRVLREAVAERKAIADDYEALARKTGVELTADNPQSFRNLKALFDSGEYTPPRE